MCFAACQDIITVFQIKEAQAYFDKADQKTLILIDIDSTLTTPSDAYLRRHAIKTHQDIFKKYVSALTKEQRRIFDHLLVLQSPSQLVESDFPPVVKELQQRGAKVLACTASKMGAVGHKVASFPEWRFQELKRLGLDFSGAFPGSVNFTSFKEDNGDFPGIEKGIIYCDHYTEKAAFFEEILQQLQIVPQKVIVIDDKRNNIEPFLTIIKDSYPAIDFVGIEYQGMASLPISTTTASQFEEKISNIAKETIAICP